MNEGFSMNLILKNSNQMPFHTDMKAIFHALQGEAEKLNWLISDLECNYWPDKRLANKVLFISGPELSSILDKYDDLQFIWGVFSGFPKGVDIDISDESKLPYADGNMDLDNRYRIPQHKDAIVEIVAWDATETIFTSGDQKLIALFKSTFTDADT
jgi:hypothetical protein